ncbi:MAG: DUF2235 domain-containing protein [Bacteroidetes bacterium]|jgi:uncharacterized protein (DUF2235 family)|nr:DUF2235 domain-containing protein [Bacteroidota bacterium]MDF1864371.1 DUF2235 domain-containing protein [Saprospiraceae bacterium]
MEPTPTKQRLALFLDGTWNTQDDSTNVRHAYTLMKEGEIEDGIIQRRYYDPGVGTGMLDSVTGGGFGLGLDANVREAYNWLVDHYNDGDEIYIFGFSRGAYTARSLMGFIATCGLIKRGAPLMVSQMWNSYIYIAQNRNKYKKWWEKSLKKYKYNFRRITSLKLDDWKNATKRSDPINDAEHLLVEWSRRVKITYMGIFDTVGAMGLEALGIPGITSRLEQHHNPYPTKLLVNCRHALAIDENRTSFRLTPLLDYVRNNAKPEESEEYKGIISQRWFVGAHANIGGGYPDNLLAMRPLEWILEGAKGAGLKIHDTEQSKFDPKDTHIRDSHAEFASPLWAYIIRSKRHYRPIQRPDDVRAYFSLRAISEEVDESVIEFAKRSKKYAPPNLLTYTKKTSNEALKTVFEDRKLESDWPGKSLKERIILICWCSLAAVGFGAFSQLFLCKFPLSSWLGFPILASLFGLIDWGESINNLKSSINPKSIVPKTTRAILLWLRLIGVLAFFAGSIGFISKFWTLGWEFSSMSIFDLYEIFGDWYLITLVAGVTVGVLNIFERQGHLNNLVTSIKAIIGAFITFIAGAFLIMFIAWLLEYLMSEIFQGGVELPKIPTSETEVLAGKILLIQVLLIIFYFSFLWVGKPLSKGQANLGSIVSLQFAFTPSKVTKLFEDWSWKLGRKWEKLKANEKKGWSSLKEKLHDCLWRDILGFTPLYTIVFGVIIWLSMIIDSPKYLSFLGEGSFIPGLAWWHLLIGLTAIADMVENTIHFKHIKHHTNGGSSAVLVGLGFVATLLKTIGFTISGLLSLVIFTSLSLKVLAAGDGGWRWIIVSSITCIIIIYAALLTILFVGDLLNQREDKKAA